MHSKGSSDFLNFFPFAFIAVILIGGGIFLAVEAFYGKPYDMRAVEADLLAQRVISCFSSHDFFEPSFNVYTSCGLVASSLEHHLIWISDAAGREWFSGIYDFKTQCSLSEKNEAYPRCVSGTFEKGGRTYNYLVGSNQFSQRT